MKFDNSKYKLTDEIPMLLSTAYDDYAKQDTNPCSICREHPEQDGKRMHFHGSDFGSCVRQVAYKMSTFKKDYAQRFHSVHPMFLKDGHVHEETILKSFEFDRNFAVFANANVMELKAYIPWFNTAIPGVDVKVEIEKFLLSKKKHNDLGEKPEVRHYAIIAHVDGLVTYNDPDDNTQLEFGIECKSVKEETWKKIQGGEVDDRWYGQIQCYMFITGIHRWYLVVKNRTTSIIQTPIRFDYDMQFVMQRLRKLNQIYTFINYEKEVPIPAGMKKNCYQCTWCDFKEKCWS